MGRPRRVDEAGGIYHMLNRANRRTTIFRTDADYEAFEQILDEALARCRLQLFAYCLMPNHWHLVVRPEVDGELSRFGQWLGLTHTQRYNAAHGTTGQGHLYQGRFKSFPVQGDPHYLSVCRYVERTPYAAKLCRTPDAWRWSSLWRWRHGKPQEKALLSPWPIPRKPDWIKWVRQPLSVQEQRRLRASIERGSPYGEEAWVESEVRRLGLESTQRPRGRPRKQAERP